MKLYMYDYLDQYSLRRAFTTRCAPQCDSFEVVVSNSASFHPRVEDMERTLTTKDWPFPHLFLLLVCEGYATSSVAGFHVLYDWIPRD